MNDFIFLVLILSSIFLISSLLKALVDRCTSYSKEPNSQKNFLKLKRIIKQKQEITIDYAYDWWKWMKQFCQISKYQNKAYVEHSFNSTYDECVIEEFGEFCTYLVKYKNVRIV